VVDRISPSPHKSDEDLSLGKGYDSNVASEKHQRFGVDSDISSIENCECKKEPQKKRVNSVVNDGVEKPKKASFRKRNSNNLSSQNSTKPAIKKPNQSQIKNKSRASVRTQKNHKHQKTNISNKPQNGNAKHWNKRSVYAALDLGTNNCRLLIARPNKDGFTIVDAFSKVVRLGEGLAKSGRISDDAMDRAVAALGICAQKLKRRNVTLSRSVATEACRQADNGIEFIKRVRDETGILLDIISSEEEARLAVLGCHVLLEPGDGPALVFDIGGGSTELALVSTVGKFPKVIDWVSVPWGVVTLTESEPITEDSISARMQGYDNMRKRVLESFSEFSDRLPKGSGTRPALGTSGTITTLASVFLELPYYNRNKVDGITVPAAAMREISQKLAHQSAAERALEPCIGEQRSDLVVAGCAILESILDVWPSDTLGVADRGIREGILRALMKNNNITDQ